MLFASVVKTIARLAGLKIDPSKNENSYQSCHTMRGREREATYQDEGSSGLLKLICQGDQSRTRAQTPFLALATRVMCGELYLAFLLSPRIHQ